MDYVSQRLQEIAVELAEESPSVRPPFKYRHIELHKTRHGRIVTYYRVGNGKRYRLPNRKDVTETEFAEAYEAASLGIVRERAKPTRGQVKGKYGSPGKPGFVYFIRNGSSVKIGFTTSIRSRVKNIQTACADPLEVLMVMPGTDETEKFFHTMFRDYRIGGEWFSLTGLIAEFVGYRCPKPSNPISRG